MAQRSTPRRESPGKNVALDTAVLMRTAMRAIHPGQG